MAWCDDKCEIITGWTLATISVDRFTNARVLEISSSTLQLEFRQTMPSWSPAFIKKNYFMKNKFDRLNTKVYRFSSLFTLWRRGLK